ncbi:MAG TPA: hypothetical protein VGD53_04920 [Actinoallomurus sp.]|jgi:hypothetical protein
MPEIEAARRDTTAIALLEVTAPLASLEEDPDALPRLSSSGSPA